MFSKKALLAGRDLSCSSPFTRFAVVGNPRTGSSHLVSMLDSHPDVACWDCEIFDQGEEFERSDYADPRDFLRERVFKVRARVVGFKLLHDAMRRTPDAWAVLKDLDVRLVHTFRANYLDSYLSFRLATVNNAFTCWYGDYTVTRVILEAEDCLSWMETARQVDDELPALAQDAHLPMLSIEYKNLCANQGSVLTFLGVPQCPLTSRLTKQRHGRQVDAIVNYVDLKRRFAGTKWAVYFDD